MEISHFRSGTAALSLKWHVSEPRAQLRMPPAASLTSAVRRHEDQVVHNVSTGCLLQHIKNVKSFGLTSIWSAITGAGGEEAIITPFYHGVKQLLPGMPDDLDLTVTVPHMRNPIDGIFYQGVRKSIHEGLRESKTLDRCWFLDFKK